MPNGVLFKYLSIYFSNNPLKFIPSSQDVWAISHTVFCYWKNHHSLRVLLLTVAADLLLLSLNVATVKNRRSKRLMFNSGGIEGLSKPKCDQRYERITAASGAQRSPLKLSVPCAVPEERPEEELKSLEVCLEVWPGIPEKNQSTLFFVTIFVPFSEIPEILSLQPRVFSKNMSSSICTLYFRWSQQVFLDELLCKRFERCWIICPWQTGNLGGKWTKTE